ncbi:MAG TPA: DUF456 domain-containing protein [Gemmatimonadales bacterium]|nr:DUF456 domain-containing protein [Gemmatimonadales bacterium]
MNGLYVVLLIAVLLGGLVLVPLGLPGLWLMVLGIVGYGAATGYQGIGLKTIVLAVALALIGELIEWWVGFKYAQRYGGTRRAGWGALLGGLAGATAGIPVPVLGSVIGSFLGSFVGAALFEYTARPANAIRTGFGALIGRLWATATKMSLGLVIAVVALFAVWS